MWAVIEIHGEELVQHIVPISDIADHDMNEGCWCHPDTVEVDESNRLIVHTSLDGREYIEQQEAQELPRYDESGLPITKGRWFYGLTLRDIATIAGVMVTFCGFVGLWVALFWWIFSTIAGVE